MIKEIKECAMFMVGIILFILYPIISCIEYSRPKDDEYDDRKKFLFNGLLGFIGIALIVVAKFNPTSDGVMLTVIGSLPYFLGMKKQKELLDKRMSF
jgi:hypothetical protein